MGIVQSNGCWLMLVSSGEGDHLTFFSIDLESFTACEVEDGVGLILNCL